MHRTARPLLIGLATLALLSPCVPATADPAPSQDDLRKADARVAAAQRRVVGLQARAEHAAEEYNGALVRSRRAAAASVRAADAADVADVFYDKATEVARAAQTEADVAAAGAAAARQQQALAQAEADAAQRTLDRIAIGAFQTGGQLGMVSQLFLADDPLELANARNVMNRVGVYQDKVIAVAAAARARAAVAAGIAADAEREARAAAKRANASLERAQALKSNADAAHQEARSAAAEASAATRDAARSRRTVLALVAQAQRALGSAVRTKAQLAAAARAARADASRYQDVDAPSDEARIAIHWAFEEIGVPYSWGGGDENGPTYGFAQGAGTKGFDCSGLTLFIYAKAGIHLDHYSQSQWDQGKRVSSRSELLPGDLMFFATDTSNPRTIHHVSIYIGKGKMIEAPYTGEVVRVSSADRSDFIGGTRPWA
ncbi:MAG TPA: NlpC/P60 family protein [Mycobacteriales bacterium]|nr:NlpC/P60 family protein [Mycobacteriales bacterium]